MQAEQPRTPDILPRPVPLPCFACGKDLTSVFPFEDGYRSQPNDGVTFSTYGNYGSGVFDEVNGTLLEINICDTCLVLHYERVWCLRYVRRPNRDIEFSQPWKPPGQLITDEIESDPEEVERLTEARQQARDGRRRPLDKAMPEVHVWEVTSEEWKELVAHALDLQGLTYEQLKEQARTQDFQSDRARSLWFMIKEEG